MTKPSPQSSSDDFAPSLAGLANFYEELIEQNPELVEAAKVDKDEISKFLEVLRHSEKELDADSAPKGFLKLSQLILDRECRDGNPSPAIIRNILKFLETDPIFAEQMKSDHTGALKKLLKVTENGCKGKPLTPEAKERVAQIFDERAQEFENSFHRTFQSILTRMRAWVTAHSADVDAAAVLVELQALEQLINEATERGKTRASIAQGTLKELEESARLIEEARIRNKAAERGKQSAAVSSELLARIEAEAKRIEETRARQEATAKGMAAVAVNAAKVETDAKVAQELWLTQAAQAKGIAKAKIDPLTVENIARIVEEKRLTDAATARGIADAEANTDVVRIEKDAYAAAVRSIRDLAEARGVARAKLDASAVAETKADAKARKTARMKARLRSNWPQPKDASSTSELDDEGDEL